MSKQTLLDTLFHPRPKAVGERASGEIAPLPVSGACVGLDVPVVSVDLESTGANVGTDKIVQLSLVRYECSGSVEALTTYVNPGRPISPQAVAIHHITDETVAQAPAFKKIARRVAAFIGDAALAGYGVAQFDIPLLEREFEEAGIELDLSSRPVLDVKVLYHRLRPRRLEDAYRDYVGRELDGAHDAGADAHAAFEVLAAMLARHPDLPQSVNTLADSLRDPVRVDPAGKFIWVNGEATFAFSKHQGKSLQDVARTDPDFLKWMLGRDFTPAVRRIVRRALEGRFPPPLTAPATATGTPEKDPAP
jgi:DNA polymerase-3 subunit epsilon